MRLESVYCLAALTFVAGCAAPRPEPPPAPATPEAPPRATIIARRAPLTVRVDGRLDDAAWMRAEAYPFTLSRKALGSGRALQEHGEVMVAWDREYLYVAVRFQDSDLVAEGADDQIRHYRLGDVNELFLKPEDQTWYWELYVTPAGKKSHWFMPGRGRLGLESNWDYQCGMRVAAQCDGTLNNWRDRDKGWTAEMAMPVKDLTARGEAFGPGARWLILLGRYNYSRYLSHKEVSQAPQMSRGNHHRIEEYATLVIEE